MTAFNDVDDRDLIPRWRDFETTVASGELRPSSNCKKTLPLGGADALHEAVTSFRSHPGVHTAGDLLSRAAVLHVEGNDVHAAARYILKQDGPAILHQVARRILGEANGRETGVLGAQPFDRRGAVHRAGRLRDLLRVEPRNAVRWTDLALVHLNLGAVQKASKNMTTALALAPENRYVLRSAVRLFLLRNDPEAAHKALTRDDRVLGDPWLQAAHLATAEIMGGPRGSLRKIRQVVESGHFSPWHVSELAGETATAELRAGNVKQAKRMMRMALQDPTENAVAQAEWAARHGIDPPEKLALSAPRTYEARALAAAQRGDLHLAVEAGQRWQNDQPFDPRPAIFLSYTAALGLEIYDVAERAALQGLVANPRHGPLRNNLVFAQASQGKVAEATGNLRLIESPSPGSREDATLTATRGLVAFRSGELDRGRHLYAKALDALISSRDRDVAALASLMWAREEVRNRTPQAAETFSRALRLASDSQSPEVHVWRDKLKQQLEEFAGEHISTW